MIRREDLKVFSICYLSLSLSEIPSTHEEENGHLCKIVSQNASVGHWTFSMQFALHYLHWCLVTIWQRIYETLSLGDFLSSYFFWGRELLEQAVQKENSLERLLYATAFACASYHGSIHRDAKPFNPLLGETYEFQDGSSWFLAEQVGEVFA